MIFGMEPSELSSSLALALARPGYGQTVEEILDTCRLVVQADQELSEEEVASIRTAANVSDQIWKRLLSIGRNDVIPEFSEQLPPSFSALYQLNLMNDWEIKQAVWFGEVTSRSTTREIEVYKKMARIRSSYKLSKRKLYMFCHDEIPDDAYQEMIEDINEIGKKYSVFFDSENLERIREADKSLLYDHKLQRLLVEMTEFVDSRDNEVKWPAPEWMDSSQLSDQERLDHIVVLLTRADNKLAMDYLKNISGSRKNMMERYGELYCMKVAQQFLFATSRTQRYNYKRRLKEVAERYPELDGTVNRLLSSYLVD